MERPYAHLVQKLRQAGLRPTRQRLALAKLLFDGPNRHVTAESLHGETEQANIAISLATIYNSLHQFTDMGLLREVVVAAGRTYFDTNVTEHHHYFMAAEGRLEDVPDDAVNIDLLCDAPMGKKFSRLNLVIHVSDDG
ncbi:Iron-responsive regulator Irr [hydrothermal vent metagenome]|uniref:Iron-responsive regulator Irr n=1 Tax=hydrothermal vent metagenome TaxID=652676 RepID=A0A3B0RY52_9ZZZZ